MLGETPDTYDPLNRKTQVTKQDGSAATTGYSGNSTTVTDEAGNQRRSLTDDPRMNPCNYACLWSSN
ncbi:MAG: hypothetical protein ACYDCM_11215 [Candidatus Acidiferrales bacterium]